MDDPCDNIACGVTGWAKWANIPTSQLGFWARVWLKGTSFAY